MGCIFFVFWFFVKNEKYEVIFREKRKNEQISTLNNTGINSFFVQIGLMFFWMDQVDKSLVGSSSWSK